MKFEWDDAKAVQNLRKHRISFFQATFAFLDPFAFEWLDEREGYGEDRIILVGMAQGQLLTVVYTERADCIRIISARRSTKNEEEDYHGQDAF